MTDHTPSSHCVTTTSYKVMSAIIRHSHGNTWYSTGRWLQAVSMASTFTS